MDPNEKGASERFRCVLGWRYIAVFTINRVLSVIAIYQAPRSWAEQAFPKLIDYNTPDKGGHFAAWEQPELFSEEVRAGFRSLRSGSAKSDVPFAKAG